jgi:hypothetical protein
MMLIFSNACACAPGTCLSAKASARRLVCCAIESIVRRVCTRQSVRIYSSHNRVWVIVNGVSESTFAPRRQKRDSKKKNNKRSRRRARRKEREATTHPKKSAEGRSGEIFPRTDTLLEGRRRRRNRSSRLAQHLEVKRTVHAILLRPEDGRQVFRHRKQSVCSLSLVFFLKCRTKTRFVFPQKRL